MISKTKNWIVESFLRLLQKKNYQDITIADIANGALLGRRTFYRYFKSKEAVVEWISLNMIDEFANRLLENNAASFEKIIDCYFDFWEENIEVFLLLKKARLLYYVEENIVQIVTSIASKVGHISEDSEEARSLIEKHKYEYAYKLAGFWKLTLLWSEESPRKSAAEMTQIITDFIGIIR